MKRFSALFCRKSWISLALLLPLLLLAVAPARAQDGGLLSIGAVDSTNFPQVHFDLFISDVSGLPVTSLTAADFQLFEDGIKVPASAIMVEPSDSQPVGLVMAVDVSAEVADLERIKDGLLGLVSQLRGGDQGVLISFSDDVRLEQPVTGNPAELQAVIQRLRAGGNYTALNRAAAEALNRAALLSTPRKVIVIVTDNVENFSTGTVPAMDPAAQSNTTVFLVAYSSKVQSPGAFDALAAQINARTYVVNSATEAQLRLQTLRSQFSRGYRLRFLSSLLADSAPHTISVNLSNRGAVMRADAIMVATPGAVEINFPDLANGQQVGGIVELAPQISTPGLAARVEFTLNGEPLATVEEAPFVLPWDTRTLLPGSHVIGVTAVDSAGNRAQQFLTLQVVDALRINASTTRENLYIGEEITIVAAIEALKGVALVEFFMDGLLVGQAASPPYQVTFDSSSFEKGTYILSVQATDTSGLMERAEYSVDLAPAPPRFLWPADTWLRILAFATILVAIALAWLLLTYLSSFGRRKRQAFYRLEVHNEGNMATSYLLRADDPQGVLAFFFRLNGLPLRGRKVIEWLPVRREAPVRRLAAPPQPVTLAAQGQGSGAAGQNGQPKQAQAKGKQGKGAQVKKKSAGLVNISRNFSGLLSAVAQLLPASMGGNIAWKAASGANQVSAGVQRVDTVNRHAEATSKGLQGKGLSAAQAPEQYHAYVAEQAAAAETGTPVAVAEQSQRQLAGEVQAVAVPVPAPWPGQQAESLGQHNGSNGYTNGAASNGSAATGVDGETRYGNDGVLYKKVVRHVDDSAWTETPEVEAGDTLLLEMVIEPKQSHRTRTYAFRISSKALAEPDTPLRVEEMSVKIRSVSWVNWLLIPALVILTTLAVILFMISYLLVDFGLISDLNSLLQQIPRR
jgi:hypothetical protein